jgi:hypothetical protein
MASFLSPEDFRDEIDFQVSIMDEDGIDWQIRLASAEPESRAKGPKRKIGGRR